MVIKEVFIGILWKVLLIFFFVNFFFFKNECLCMMGDDLILGWERKLIVLIIWFLWIGWGLGFYGFVFGLFFIVFDLVIFFVFVFIV